MVGSAAARCSLLFERVFSPVVREGQNGGGVTPGGAAPATAEGEARPGDGERAPSPGSLRPDSASCPPQPRPAAQHRRGDPSAWPRDGVPRGGVEKWQKELQRRN